MSTVDEMNQDEILKKQWELAETNPFPKYNHIRLESVERDKVRMYVDLVPESLNFLGGVHGGLYFTLADFCAATTARTDGRRYVTIDAQAHYIGTVHEGRITAESRLIHRGRTSCLVEVDVRSDDGRLLFKCEVMMFCLGE